MTKIKTMLLSGLLTGIFLLITACSAKEELVLTDNNNTGTSILSVLSDTNSYYSDTFETGKITTINIDINDDDWDDLCKNAINETYYRADITVNETTITNVGFRAKGNSTLMSVARSDSNRYGFKIKFDKYVDDQTLNGLDMMVLNTSFCDPSYMREYLTYAASNYLGCFTPFVSYTRLYINGEYYGLYLSIEAFKDGFTERYTNDEDAVLYKAVSEDCTLLPSDDTLGFNVEYGKDEGNSNIKNLIEALNNTTADNKDQLESILDVDSVLKAMAVNVVTGNYDSYSGSKAHNYYLLYSDGKFKYIGWDYNMSFGGFTEDGGGSVTVDIEDPFFNIDSSNRVLMSKLLQIDEYKTKYLSYVDKLVEYFSDYEDKIDSISNLIKEHVETDPTAFYTIEQFEKNIVKSETDLSQINRKNIPRQNDKTLQNGEKPTMPNASDKPQEGMTPPEANGENMPQEGMTPPRQDGQNIAKGGGNMISEDTVSIADYISQRLERIK